MKDNGDVSPWQLGGLTARELGRRVWIEFTADEVTDRAAALSYYFLFALFPALLFFTALLGFLPVPGLMDRLMAYLDQVLPGDAGAVIERTLTEVLDTPRGGLRSVGALATLWAASNGMASVIDALNVAYDIEDRRPWWTRRLIAVALTVGFAVMLLAGLVFLVFGGTMGAAAALAPPGRRVPDRLDPGQHRGGNAAGADRFRPRLLPGPGRSAAVAVGHAGVGGGARPLARHVVRPAPLRDVRRQLQRDLWIDRRSDPSHAVALPPCCSSAPR